MAYNTLMCC